MTSGGAEYTFNEIAGEWDRTDLTNTLDEVVITSGDFDNSHAGDYDDRAGVDQSYLDLDAIDNIGDVAEPFARYGSTSNIASQTFAATVRGAQVSNNAVAGLATLGKVSQFNGIATGLGRAAPFISVGVGTLKIQEGYKQDGGTFGSNAKSATGGAVGSLVGGYAGAEAGAAIGAAVGVWFGGVGAVPGAIIGGIIGGIGGSMAGEEIGKEIVNKNVS